MNKFLFYGVSILFLVYVAVIGYLEDRNNQGEPELFKLDDDDHIV